MGLKLVQHYAKTEKMREKLIKADLIIVASPVYILHMSGQLKTFLDHFPTLFIIHRPDVAMFKNR